jgi:hypothetical protein
MSVDRGRIVRLTEEYGGEWAIQHAERLLRLIEIIGEGLSYNQEAMWIAAHMHDWGTLPKFHRKGQLHAQCSCRVAGEYLRKWKCPQELMDLVLEAIEFHHGGADDRSIEAQLLRDADALDGIGVIGLLREMAQIPTEGDGPYPLPVGAGMSGACDRARMRLENNPAVLRLPKSRELARQRVASMQCALEALERESFGFV